MKKKLVVLSLLVFTLPAAARPVDCEHVGTDLNELASADQQIRQEWSMLEQNPKALAADKDLLQKRWRDVDGENLRQVKEIIAACGWPKTKKDSHSAWLLAQHADGDLPFQRLAKGLLEASVKAGIAAPRDLAYLADRIAANEGRPQEYGTQFTQTDRCHLVLNPIDDRALVNQRRQAVGLQSLEEYEAEGRKRFIPPDCPAKTSEKKNPTIATEKDYAQIGRFIYTAYRYGGDVADVHNWMADELGIARPASSIGTVPNDLYDAFFAKYTNGDDFQASYERFVEKLSARKP